MMVSAKSAIWVPAEPITAGAKVARKRLMCFFIGGPAKRSKIPARWAAAEVSTSCSTPETVNPQLAADAGIGE